MWLNLRKQKYWLLVLIFTFISFLSLAQKRTKEVSALIENEQYELAISKAQDQLTESSGFNISGRLLQLQADAYYYLNDIDKSLAHYLKAIEQFEASQEPSLLNYMECYSHAGFCYREQGKYDKALSYYLTASKLAIVYNDSTDIAAQYANLGNVYGKLGAIETATNYHLKAYAIDLARKDTAGIGFDLRNIADLKILVGDYSSAIIDLVESIKLLQFSNGNPNSLAMRHGKLGQSYLAIGELDNAEHYLNISLEEHMVLKDSIHVALRWIDLAQLYAANEDYDKSIDVGHLSKNFFTNAERSQFLAKANLALIKAYKNTLNHYEANLLINENIKICNINKLLVELKETLKEQGELFQAMNRPQEALVAYKQYNKLEDSIINLNNKKAIALLEVTYNIYKVEQENELLSLENRMNKTELSRQNLRFRFMSIIFIIVVIAAIVISWFIMSRQKLKSELLQTEINQLRSQIMAALDGDTTALKLNANQINKSLSTPLSNREFEILNHALSDMSNSQIANITFVSVNTVKYHLKNIYEKLGVGNRKEALQFAIQSGK